MCHFAVQNNFFSADNVIFCRYFKNRRVASASCVAHANASGIRSQLQTFVIDATRNSIERKFHVQTCRTNILEKINRSRWNRNVTT